MKSGSAYFGPGFKVTPLHITPGYKTMLSLFGPDFEVTSAHITPDFSHALLILDAFKVPLCINCATFFFIPCSAYSGPDLRSPLHILHQVLKPCRADVWPDHLSTYCARF